MQVIKEGKSELCENSEFVNPEMSETLSYPFQKDR